jgi:phage-related protein
MAAAGSDVQLAIKIAGKIDNSYKGAMNSAKSEASGLSKALESAGKAASSASSGALSKIKSHFSSLKSAISGMGGVIAGFAATAGAAFTFKGIMDSATAAEKTQAQMAAVLKSTGGAAGMTMQQLNDLAASQAKVTTFSAGTTKQAENMLLTFTNIKSNVFPQTIKATEDFATATGTDATTAAKTLGKALNDPATGYTKLQRSGVVFTAAQIKTIKSMEAAGNTAGAQKVMLQELEKEYGGSAKAAGDTLAGQMQKAGNALKGVGATIGLSLMPAVNKLVPLFVGAGQKIADFISAHQQDITNAISNVGNVIGKIVQAIEKYGPMVMSTISSVISNVISKVGPIVQTVLPQVLGAIKNVVEFISSHKQEAIAAIIGIGSAIAAAGIGAKIKGVVDKFKDVKKGIDGLKGAAKGAKIFESLFGMSPQAALVLVIIAAVAAAAFLIIKNWGPISKFFIGIWNSIKKTFSGIGAWFGNVFNGAKAGVQSAWSGVAGFFGGIWNGIKGVFGAVGGWFKNVFSGACNGIKAAWGGVTGFFSGIWDGIVKVFSVVVSFYAGIFKGAWSAITAVWSVASGWFGNIWNGIKSVFKPDLISGGFRNAWSAVQNVWHGAGAWFGGIWQSIKDGFTKLNPIQWGKDLINGIANGIKSAANAVKSAVWNVAQNIRSFLHFSRRMKAPLRTTRRGCPTSRTASRPGSPPTKARWPPPSGDFPRI